MNYLIDEIDVYEITCNRLNDNFQNDTEAFGVMIKEETRVVYQHLISITYELLKLNPMSEEEKCRYVMKKAAQMFKVQDERGKDAIVTTNFEKLRGKMVHDDEVDQHLLIFLGRFFKKHSGHIVHRISATDLFISTDFSYQKIVNRLGYFVRRGVLRYSSLSGKEEYELEKGGFEMLEKLQQSSKLSLLPENRYFQLVPLSSKVKEPFVFVLMPFNKDEIEQKVYSEIIKPIVEKELNISCIRSDEVTDPGVINNQIFALIRRAKLVIAETSSRNPNVFYEVGMAHTFNKDVFIFNNSSNKNLPFDIITNRAVFYDDYEDLKKKLVENLKDHI